MALCALSAQRGTNLRLERAVGDLVALLAARGEQRVVAPLELVWVVAGDAGHLRALLEAAALAQPLKLVVGVDARDARRALYRLEIVGKHFPRPEGEGRSGRYRTAPVALAADVDQPLTRQPARVNDMLRLLAIRAGLVIGDVLVARSVAAFARDP